jgi:hypothetical protein
MHKSREIERCSSASRGVRQDRSVRIILNQDVKDQAIYVFSHLTQANRYIQCRHGNYRIMSRLVPSGQAVGDRNYKYLTLWHHIHMLDISKFSSHVSASVLQEISFSCYYVLLHKVTHSILCSLDAGAEAA